MMEDSCVRVWVMYRRRLDRLGEEIEGGHFGQVRRLRGVILEGEEIEGGYTRWPKATHRGRRPPAREASVPPAGTRRRAAERLELLVYDIRKSYDGVHH